jgi:phosphatidylinositol alpha-1,6-mannosyltransferase
MVNPLGGFQMAAAKLPQGVSSECVLLPGDDGASFAKCDRKGLCDAASRVPRVAIVIRSRIVPSILLGMTGLRVDGGIASVNRSIVRALDARVREGAIDRVDRALLHEDPERRFEPCARGEERLAGGRQSVFVWHFWRMVRKLRPDLVFFDHVGLARAALLPLPSLPPDRYAIFVHGGELASALEGGRARAMRSAWRILVNSEFTRTEVVKAFPDLADRIRLTRLSVDPERIEAWQAAAPKGHDREPAALIVGRMSEEERGKGHDHLIEAWPTVLASLPEARLWIAGDGGDRTRLEALAKKRQVSHAVEFLGRVSDEELHDLYEKASLFAMPSRQEGFGLVYAEAMWHGLPCLGSDADAARCVIDHGTTGWLVSYGDVPAIADAVIQALSDSALVSRMGAAGRRVVDARFSSAQFEGALLEALDLGALKS